MAFTFRTIDPALIERRAPRAAEVGPEYLEALEFARGNDGRVQIDIEAPDTKRAVRRRLAIVAKSAGFPTLIWLDNKKADDNIVALRFQTPEEAARPKQRRAPRGSGARANGATRVRELTPV